MIRSATHNSVYDIVGSVRTLNIFPKTGWEAQLSLETTAKTLAKRTSVFCRMVCFQGSLSSSNDRIKVVESPSIKSKNSMSREA